MQIAQVENVQFFDICIHVKPEPHQDNGHIITPISLCPFEILPPPLPDLSSQITTVLCSVTIDNLAFPKIYINVI